VTQQFSLFGAAAAEPSLADLDGVLLAGGHWVRSGDTARLSVVVADRWRADGVAAEYDVRGVAGDDAVVPAEEGWSARTAFTAGLAEQAARWTRGANEGPPREFSLTAGGLRLWALAAGRPDEGGFLLGTPRIETVLHLSAGAQLSRLGMAAVSIGVRGGPGWRITSAKRIRRFVELVGPPPDGLDRWL
jgi:hypothetical protein